MDKQKPVNDIYWIPIEDLSFLECVPGEAPAMGVCLTSFLVEGSNPANARNNAMKYPGFYRNWVKLTQEQKQRIQPFRFPKAVKTSEIEKVLYCPRRFKSRDETYTCGEPVPPENINGEFGGCCINRYDIPKGISCPYETSDHVRPRI